MNKRVLQKVQEQVDLMYASAEHGDQMHGKNITSIRLRQFADRIQEALKGAGDE